MTRCATGQHDFPIEDESGAYCPEHGVTLVWHGPPITDDGTLAAVNFPLLLSTASTTSTAGSKTHNDDD